MSDLLKKRWYVAVVLIVVGIVFFYQKTIVKSQSKKEVGHIVKRQTLEDTLSIAGQIEAGQRAELKFQTSGLLNWVGVKKGDQVKKYQGIASLDQRELEKNLKKYLNTFMQDRFDLDQTRDDYKNQAITDEMRRIMDKAQYDLDNSIIDVELKDLALQYSYLSTPIEGIVVRVDTPYPGVNITPAGAVFEVANPNSIYFSANADQTEVTRLKEKMKAEIALDAYSDKKLYGVVSSISFIPKTGETGTAYEVKVTINDDNRDYKYKLGMTGDVTFNLSVIKNVLSVPGNYVKADNGKKYVWVMKNNKKTKQYVKIGKETDTDTQIISGLTEADVIYD